jgi:hypothetical protein
MVVEVGLLLTGDTKQEHNAMNEINYPETTKYVIVQIIKEGVDEFQGFVVEPHHQFSSGNPIIRVFDSKEMAEQLFPDLFKEKEFDLSDAANFKI